MPVDIATGAVFTAAHDVEIDGAYPLVFRRVYDTDALREIDGLGPADALRDTVPSARRSSAFGPGWAHTFDATLIRDLDGFTFRGHETEALFDEPREGFREGGSILSPGDWMELRHCGSEYWVIHWHDVSVPTIRYVFEASSNGPMRLKRLETMGGQGAVLSYESSRLVEIAQTHDVHRLRLDYDGAGRVASLSLFASGFRPLVAARYEYDSRGMLRSAYNALGAAIRYEYDVAGRLVAETSRSGATWQMEYDERGRCVCNEGDGGRERRRFQYMKGVTQVTDSRGYDSLHEYNDRGQVERVIGPSGASHVTRFDEYGRVIARVGPLGEETLYAFDENGNRTTTRWPNGGLRTITWDSDHLPVEIVDANGARWTIDNVRGLPSHLVDPVGNETRSFYDEYGNLQTIVAPSGNQTRITRTFDSLEMTDALGLSFRQRVDIWNEPIEYYGAGGLERRFERDLGGRLIAEEDAYGATWSYTLDPEENVTKVQSPDGSIQRVEYSLTGDILREIDAAGGVHTFEYDSEGRLIVAHDPLGRTATWTRDMNGNVTAVRHFEGTEERFERDLAGRVVRHHRADGTRLDLEYSIMGQVLSIRCGDKPLLEQEIDIVGRPVRVVTPDAIVELTYDLLGRVVTEKQNGRALSLEYSASGMTRRALDGASCGPLSFEFDARGRLGSISDERGLRESFDYDGCNSMVRRRMGGAQETNEFDRNLRIAEQVVTGVAARHYAYDASSRLVGVNDAHRPPERFEYDSRGWLAASRTPERATRFVRDAIGNLREGSIFTEGGAQPLRTQEALDVERDACGRVIRVVRGGQSWSLAWNALDQLVRSIDPAGVATEYGYDGFSRRVFKETDGRRTEFYWLGDDLVEERGHGGVIDYATSDSATFLLWENGTPFHAISDYRGAIQELLDEDGNLSWAGDYGPLGDLRAARGDGPTPAFRLAGQYYDEETGLHYNRYRYYDPGLGQYLSPDPINYGGGWNRYQYPADPINFSDPLGLSCNGNNKGKNYVYVLEEGTGPNGGPPYRIVYVGITDNPATRAAAHRANPSKSFTRMRVVQQGTCRRSARNLEGSALHHAHAGNLGNQSPNGLQNAPRPVAPGYYHAYGNPPGGNRVLLPSSTVDSRLQQNFGIY